MKNYTKLEMDIISLRNEDVLTASGIQGVDESQDPNGYCISSTDNLFEFGDCVSACYGLFTHNQNVCNWYRGGKQGNYPGRWSK